MPGALDSIPPSKVGGEESKELARVEDGDSPTCQCVKPSLRACVQGLCPARPAAGMEENPEEE